MLQFRNKVTEYTGEGPLIKTISASGSTKKTFLSYISVPMEAEVSFFPKWSMMHKMIVLFLETKEREEKLF